MAGMNWGRVQRENKAYRSGTEPVTGIGPRAPEGDRFDRKGNKIISSPSARKKKPAASKAPALAQAEIDLLSFVARSVAQGRWIDDKLPKSVTTGLWEKVQGAGGLVKWAKGQPSYAKYFERARKKEVRNGTFVAGKSDLNALAGKTTPTLSGGKSRPNPSISGDDATKIRQQISYHLAEIKRLKAKLGVQKLR